MPSSDSDATGASDAPQITFQTTVLRDNVDRSASYGGGLPDVDGLGGVSVETAPNAVVCVNHDCPEEDGLIKLSGTRSHDIVVCEDHAKEEIAAARGAE